MLLSRARGGGLTRIHGIVDSWNRGYWGGVLGGANRIETMAQHLGKLGWLVALVLSVVLDCGTWVLRLAVSSDCGLYWDQWWSRRRYVLWICIG